MNLYRHLPNLITLSNLALGMLAIISSLNNELLWAATFIALATIPDFLDGSVARLLNVSSNIGKDLDSLADLVSFGVAPGVLVFRLSEQFVGSNHWINFVSILIPVFAALRLAKFNNDERQTEEFFGLTTTVTALWLSTWPLLIEYDPFLPDEWLIKPALFAVIPVFSAFMMNANIRLFSLKFKNLSWQDNQLRFAFLILCIGYLALFLFLGVSLILITYIVLSVIRNFAE